MLSFPVFAKLQPRPDPQVALSRLVLFYVPFIETLCFQAFTHSFSNGTSQPFPFQSLPHSSFAPLLNRVEQFLWNQTVPHSFPSQRGYTPLSLFSSAASAPISSISRRPSHFSSTTYKMLLPQLLCFDSHPFSGGRGEGYFSYFWGILLLFTIPDEF